ncbi:hypothetical protein FHW69_003843, partial [Luteibacter sp. Sphag1AF]|uniref:hypothetical protein n=1 Tax=Luteibacter sp. Sphag1AF TaxID=2587031 RepID=UPI00160BCE11
GLTADGQELPYGPIDETATTDSFLIFVVPNERVAGLAPQGSVALYYEVLKSTGPKRSVQRNLIVTGEAVTLQAPSVREARDGALDPEALTDGLAHLELGPYPLMALGDEVTYYWTATAPGGATWFKTEGRDVSGNDVTPVPKALVFTLTRAEIELIKGYTVSVYYTVTHFASGMKSTSRALELRIGGVITLPPPLVDHVVNGYLDPASAPTGTNIRVRTDYSGAVHGDFANVYWNALLPYSNIHAVDPARPEVVSPVGVEYITGNEGRQVTVSYTITHQGQPARQGGSTTFVIGTATSPLPAPSVLEAGAGNTLPGDATKATVRVPVGAALAVNDVVTVHWKGTVGAGTVDVSKTVTTEAGSYIDLDIPAVAIAANAGLTVRVTYTIRRYSNGRLDGPSPEYVLNVQATAPVPLFEDFSSLPIGTLIPFNNPLEAPTMTIYRQSPQFGNLRISNLQPPGHPLTSFGESAEEGLPNERVAGLFLKNSYSKVTFEFMLWNYPPFLITATDDTGELAMDNLSLMESIGTVTLIPYPGKRIKAIFVRGIFMVTNFYFTP